MNAYIITLTLNNRDIWQFDIKLPIVYDIEQYLTDAINEKSNFNNAYTVKQKKTVHGIVLFHAISSIQYKKV
jgi:hypothetical protein